MIAMLMIPYLTYYDVILCAYLSVCSFILKKRLYLILKLARDWLQYKRFGHYTGDEGNWNRSVSLPSLHHYYGYTRQDVGF